MDKRHESEEVGKGRTKGKKGDNNLEGNKTEASKMNRRQKRNVM